MRLSQVPFTLLLLFVAPGLCWAFWLRVLYLGQDKNVVLCLLFGAFLGIITDHQIAKKYPFLRVYEHEFTHALVALIFIRKIEEFKVTLREGGYVKYTDGFGGEFGNITITLAPYVLPTMTCGLVGIRLLSDQNPLWFDLFIGATLGYHTWSTINETLANWGQGWWPWAKRKTDIEKVHPLFAMIYIPVVSLATHGIIFAAFAGPEGILSWGKEVCQPTIEIAKILIFYTGLNTNIL